MSEFRIDKPGLYRQRNDMQAWVTCTSSGGAWWYGFNRAGDKCQWLASGRRCNRATESPDDLVAPWTDEPAAEPQQAEPCIARPIPVPVKAVAPRFGVGDWVRCQGKLGRIKQVEVNTMLTIDAKEFTQWHPSECTKVTFRPLTPDEMRKLAGKAIIGQTDGVPRIVFEANGELAFVLTCRSEPTTASGRSTDAAALDADNLREYWTYAETGLPVGVAEDAE